MRKVHRDYKHDSIITRIIILYLSRYDVIIIIMGMSNPSMSDDGVNDCDYTLETNVITMQVVSTVTG